MAPYDRPTWARISALMDAALDRPPHERAVFLEAACAGDDALRAEVAALLAAADEAPAFLDGQAADLVAGVLPEPDADHPDAADVGARIGPYRLIRLLGRGGMGAVYLARRDDGHFDHQVALKLLPPDRTAGRIRRRFVQERQVLARLDHPGIARLLDGGVTSAGHPFFVMEYVDGQPIDVYCREHGLPLEERLHLMLAVCEAVHAAHQNLVVHRDLKPSNILVTHTTGSNEARVKLLDFGIAKVLDESADPESEGLLTRTGERWMTPSYAAPEQIRGGPITTATDIYQLGVLLYEVLTGHRPFTTDTTSPYLVQQAICEDAPPPPSETAERTRTATPGEAPASAPVSAPAPAPVPPHRLRGDLDAIVLKALRKEPGARYASAEALAEDLRRYLRYEPVQARRGTTRYRLRKFVQRHRRPVLVATAALLLLIALSTVYALHLTQARRDAEQSTRLARIEAEKNAQITDFLINVFAEANPEERDGEVVTVEDVLERGAARVRTDLADQPAEQARLLHVIGRVQRIRGQYEDAQDLLRQAATLFETLQGPTSPDAAEALYDLALTYRDQRNAEQALPLLREVVTRYRLHYGPDDPRLTSTQVTYAEVLRDVGHPDSAEVLVREALETLRRQPEPDEQRLLYALEVLAYVQRAQNKLAEAESTYREVIARKIARHGEQAETLAPTWNNLGYVLRLQERYAEAEDAYRQALDITRRVYGETHPHSLLLLQNLASVLSLQQRYDETRTLLEHRLTLMREAYPPGHWRIGGALLAVAKAYLRGGDIAGAEPYAREAVAIWHDGLGPEHVWTARAQSLLAACREALGQTDDAAALRARSLAVLQSAAPLGPDHQPTIQDVIALYEAEGRHDLALTYRALLPETP